MDPCTPTTLDRMAEERQHEMRRLARADADVRTARRQAGRSPWRRAVGRSLVAGAVAIGVPRSQRRAAQIQVTTTLGFEHHC